MADGAIAKDMTRRILMILAGAGGSIVDSFLDPYGRLRIANMYIEDGAIQRHKMVKKLRALEEQHLISIKEKKGEIQISLEKAGSERVLRYQIDEMKIPRPSVWDHKWRLILFDIPEEKKVARNYFKSKLDDLGFMQLQHSAYIHPFPCHNEIEFIRTVYGINDNVKILIVDKLEGEAVLRKQFDL